MNPAGFLFIWDLEKMRANCTPDLAVSLYGGGPLCLTVALKSNIGREAEGSVH